MVLRQADHRGSIVPWEQLRRYKLMRSIHFKENRNPRYCITRSDIVLPPTQTLYLFPSSVLTTTIRRREYKLHETWTCIAINDDTTQPKFECIDPASMLILTHSLNSSVSTAGSRVTSTLPAQEKEM